MIPLVSIGLAVVKRIPKIWWLVLVLTVGLLAQSKFYTWQLGKREKTIAKQAGVIRLIGAQRDSVEAVRDTTITRMEDSLTRLSEKKVLQVAPPDGTTSVTNVTATVKPLKLRDVKADVDSITADGWRASKWKIYGAPYHVIAEILVPPQPDTPMVHLDIRLDTAKLKMMLTCRPPTDTLTGFRPARLSVQGPGWLNLKLEMAQDPEVCNPKLPILLSEDETWWQRHSTKIYIGTLLLGGGYVLGRRER
jgi:hypothetical protein